MHPVAYSRDTYTLEGVGPDGMIIHLVSRQLIASGAIKVGDLVVAEPSADLPKGAASLRRVGRITAIHRDSPPVTCTLQVAPLVDADSLRHLYVFDPTPVE